MDNVVGIYMLNTNLQDSLHEILKARNMKINVGKTKIMHSAGKKKDSE